MNKKALTWTPFASFHRVLRLDFDDNINRGPEILERGLEPAVFERERKRVSVLRKTFL